MKKMIAVMLLCALVWAVPALGETEAALKSSAAAFGESLGETWNAFLDMLGEAGKSVSGWLDGASKDVQAFFEASIPVMREWLNEAGQYFTENVTPEISAAWNTLVEGAADLGGHAQEEIEKAYAELTEWLKQTNADEEVREALDGVAEAAGIEVERAESDVPVVKVKKP